MSSFFSFFFWGSCGMVLAGSIQKMSVVVFGMFVAMLGVLSIVRGVAASRVCVGSKPQHIPI